MNRRIKTLALPAIVLLGLLDIGMRLWVGAPQLPPVGEEARALLERPIVDDLAPPAAFDPFYDEVKRFTQIDDVVEAVGAAEEQQAPGSGYELELLGILRDGKDGKGTHKALIRVFSTRSNNAQPDVIEAVGIGERLGEALIVDIEARRVLIQSPEHGRRFLELFLPQEKP